MRQDRVSPENIRLEGRIIDERTVEEGLRKLVYSAEVAENVSVFEWGWDDFDEYTLVDGDQSYWIGPVERSGLGFAYLTEIDDSNGEIAHIVENASENTLDQLSDGETLWSYQIASTVIPENLGDPEDLLEFGSELAVENGAYAIAKVYSDESLGL